MKKIITIALVSVLLISLGGIAFASTFDSPAKIYADLTEKTVEEVYEERSTDKTFGQLAQENDIFEEFQAANLEIRKAILQERVNEGTITQEQADAMLKAMEEGCTLEPGSRRLGQEYGLGFGGRGADQGQGLGRGMRQGNGQGMGQGMRYGQN